MLTTLNLTGVFVLTFVIPQLVRMFQQLYKRAQPHHSFETTSHEYRENETSDLLDVHLTLISCIIEAVAYIVVGATNTLATQLSGTGIIGHSIRCPLTSKLALFAGVVLLGFGAGRVPVFRSLVAASVGPLEQGGSGEYVVTKRPC